MANEIEVLGILVDSRQVVKADKDLDKLAKTSAKTERATEKLTGTTKRASDVLRQEGQAATGAARATDALAASTTKASFAQRTLNDALRQARSLMVAFIGIQGARALKNLADEATNVRNRLRQVTESQAELNALFGDMTQLAIRTRSALSSTSLLYQRLTIASSDLGLSQKEVLRLSETINKSFAVSGATAIEAAGATRQLAQGLAAGALRGDEFNSVAEQAPLIMRAISDETGLAIGQLREFAATGGITAEIVINALKGIEEEIDQRFLGSIATFDQKMTNLNTELVFWAGNNEDLTITMSAVADVFGLVAVAGTVLLDIVFKATRGWIELGNAASDVFEFFGGDAVAAQDTLNTSASEYVDLNILILEGIGFVNKAMITLVQVALTPLAFVYSLGTIAAQGFANALLSVGAAAADLIPGQKAYADLLRDLQTDIPTVTEMAEEFAATFDMMRDSVDGVVETMVDMHRASPLIFRDMSVAAVAARKHAAEMKRLKSAIALVVGEIDEETAALKRTDRAQAEHVLLLDLGIEANSAMAVAVIEANNAYFDQVDAIEAAKKAAKDYQRAVKQAAKEQQRAFEKAFDFTADLLEKGIKDFDNFGDTVVNIFKDMLTRMVAEIAASQILKFFGIVGGSFTIAGAATAAGGGGAGGGAAGALGQGLLSGATSLLSGTSLGTFFGIGGGTAAATTAGGVTAPTGASLFGSGGSSGFLTQLGNSPFVQAITDFAPAVAGLAGALEGFNISGFKGALTGAAGGFFGAKAGAIFGASIAGPIGAAVGAILGGLLGGKLGAKLFGGDFVTKGAGIQLGVTGGIFDAQAFERQKKQGGILGGGTKRRTLLSDLDPEQSAAFDEAFTVIQGQVLDAYAVLGKKLGTDVFDSFNVAIRQIKTSGKTEEEIEAAIAQYFTEVSNQMTRFLGEDVSFERLLELAEGLGVVNGVLDTLGVATLEASKEGALLALQLLNVAGGMETLIENAGAFHRLFVERDPMVILKDSLTSAVTELGHVLPETRDGFTDLVQGLDLTTASGKRSFATLISLSVAADAYYSELEKLSKEQQDADIKAQEDILKALQLNVDNALQGVARSVELAKEQARAQFDIDLAALRARTEGEIAATAARIERANNAVGILGTLVRSLNRAFDPTGGNLASGRASAQADIFAAAGTARAGGSLQGIDLTEALGVIARPSEQLFGSLIDFQRDQRLTNNALRDLRDEAELQLTTAEKQLEFLKDLKLSQAAQAVSLEEQLRSNLDEELAGLELQLEIARELVDGIDGVNESVLDVGSAMRELAAAIKELGGGKGGVSQSTTDSINSQLEGIYTSTLGRASDAAGLQFYSGLVSSGALSLSEVRDQIAASPEGQGVPGFSHGGFHGGGARIVGEDGPEMEFTGPSRIMNNGDLMSALSNAELVELTKRLVELSGSLPFIAEGVKRIATLQNDWDLDGLPPERTTS